MYRIADLEIDPGAKLRCVSPPELAIHEGDLCIVEAEKRLEFGRVLHLAESQGELPRDGLHPTVLRRATLQDQSKANENALMSKMARDKVQGALRERNLKLRLVRVRYSFDRGVLMVLFTCEEKTDMRQVARELGQELHTRLEMKQIGVRDEAGIIGGVASCGRNFCCCTWLKQFASINVRMAKTQGLSLNPGAIGGNCGRLKCCLSYEYDLYRALAQGLPRPGSRVECGGSHGVVLECNVLAQRLRVRMDDNGVGDFDATEVRESSDRSPRKRRQEDEDSDPEWAEPESSGQA